MKRHIPTSTPFHLRHGFGGQVIPAFVTGIAIAFSI